MTYKILKDAISDACKIKDIAENNLSNNWNTILNALDPTKNREIYWARKLVLAVRNDSRKLIKLSNGIIFDDNTKTVYSGNQKFNYYKFFTQEIHHHHTIDEIQAMIQEINPKLKPLNINQDLVFEDSEWLDNFVNNENIASKTLREENGKWKIVYTFQGRKFLIPFKTDIVCHCFPSGEICVFTADETELLKTKKQLIQYIEGKI